MKCICIHTTGKNFTGCRRYCIVCTSQTSNRIKEDNYVVTTFYQTFCLFQYDTCNFYVAFCRFVESRSNYFCINAARHVCYFFRAFVNQQHNHVNFRVVGCDSVCDIFH